MSRAMLTTALAYAARGWPVFPCHQPVSFGCSCGHTDCASAAQHPRTARGLHDASTDPATITAWWHRWPNANIAVRTGSGGRHYWFAHPGGVVRNSASHLGPGLDIRGDGGYVIAPPSRHATGGRYLWASEGPLATAPNWLSLCRQREPRRPAPTETWRPSPASPAWARAALEGEVHKLRSAPEGVRNHTLNRAAFALGQLVGAGHLSKDVVRGALLTAGLEIGLTGRETRATVASGLQAGSRSPRSPSRRLPASIETSVEPA